MWLEGFREAKGRSGVKWVKGGGKGGAGVEGGAPSSGWKGEEKGLGEGVAGMGRAALEGVEGVQGWSGMKWVKGVRQGPCAPERGEEVGGTTFRFQVG